jgi:hypothetical protein
VLPKSKKMLVNVVDVWADICSHMTVEVTDFWSGLPLSIKVLLQARRYCTPITTSLYDKKCNHPAATEHCQSDHTAPGSGFLTG